MPRMDWIRFMLCSATLLLALLSTNKPSQAEGRCPPGMLPNNNPDFVGCAPDNSPKLGGTSGASQSIPEVDTMKSRVKTSISMLELMGLGLKERQKLLNDPRYQAYINGTWDFFQGKNDPAPGESCAALFSKKDGIVMVSGPDKIGLF